MTSPIRPILVFGRREEAELLRYGGTHTDNGEPILLYARTAEFNPGGVGGRSSFIRLFVAVTFTVPFELRLTPYIDGKTMAGESADIVVTQADYDDPDQDLTKGVRATHLFEIALSLPYMRDEVERFRFNMQGSYFQVAVEQVTPLAEAGVVIIESIEVETKPLTRGSVQ